MGGGSDVTVSVVPVPDSPYVLEGIVNKKQVMFKVETSAPRGLEESELKGLESLKTRAPLNLCLVLDRSGSMESKDKLTFAKKAVISVMNLLQKDDIVHLVTYEDAVDVVFENITAPMREAMIPKVQAIRTAGCTNLSGGIEMGAKILDKHHRAGYSRRLFLFSDGLANRGIQGKEGINTLVKSLHEKYSIKFDSFGIGDDYDSDVMRGIADNGGSEFFYLEKVCQWTAHLTFQSSEPHHLLTWLLYLVRRDRDDGLESSRERAVNRWFRCSTHVSSSSW